MKSSVALFAPTADLPGKHTGRAQKVWAHHTRHVENFHETLERNLCQSASGFALGMLAGD